MVMMMMRPHTCDHGLHFLLNIECLTTNLLTRILILFVLLYSSCCLVSPPSFEESSIPTCGTFGPSQYFNSPTATANTLSFGSVGVGAGYIPIFLYGCQPQTVKSIYYGESRKNTTLFINYSYTGDGFFNTWQTNSTQENATFVYSSGQNPLIEIAEIFLSPKVNKNNLMVSFFYQNSLLASESSTLTFNKTTQQLENTTYFYKDVALPQYVTEIVSDFVTERTQTTFSYTLDETIGLFKSISIYTGEESLQDNKTQIFSYNSDNLIQEITVQLETQGQSYSASYNFVYDVNQRLTNINSSSPGMPSCEFQLNYNNFGNISSFKIIGQPVLNNGSNPYNCVEELYFYY